MLLQVWDRKSGEDVEGGGEGVSRFLRAAAGRPRALLPLQVHRVTPIPRNLLLVQGGRSWRNLLVRASLLALWTGLQGLKTGNSGWTISRSNKGAADVIVHAIWSPGRRRCQFFGRSLNPVSRITESHSALNIIRWGSRVTCDGKSHFLWRDWKWPVGLETSAVQTWRTKTTSLSRFNSQISMTLTSILKTARFSATTQF